MTSPSFQAWFRQFRTLWPTLMIVYVPALSVLGGITAYAFATGRHVWYFTNDPFVLGGLPFYAGVLSSLTILLWGAGAAICFFSSWVLPAGLGLRPLRLYLFASGCLTSLFLFDDLFQFHRILYIKYLHLSADFIFVVYGLLALWYGVTFRKEIRETDYLLLGLALIYFAAAVVFDSISLLPRGRTAVSDGLKFFGVVGWAAYFVRTARQALREAFKSDFAADPHGQGRDNEG